LFETNETHHLVLFIFLIFFIYKFIQSIRSIEIAVDIAPLLYPPHMMILLHHKVVPT